MKKLLITFLAILMVAGVVVGCHHSQGDGNETTTKPETTFPIEFTEGEIDYLYSNAHTINAGNWSLTMASSKSGMLFHSGHFGEFTVLPSMVFSLEVQSDTGKTTQLNSTSRWASVDVSYTDEVVKMIFDTPQKIEGIKVEVTGKVDSKGISWYTNIVNESKTYTVTSASYPAPTVVAETMSVFVPDRSGRVYENVEKKSVESGIEYPGFHASMQYYAYWGKETGIYLGVHDPDAGKKSFSVDADVDGASLSIKYPAIGYGTMGNSFALGGYMRWEFFEGDWYDATEIYADFVHGYANWLPEKGRPDTADCFKEIGMWANYFGTDTTDAMLRWQRMMDAPIGCHAYHWHQITFDTHYPHYLPAKAETLADFQKMSDAGIYVIPYTNGISWGMTDSEAGFEMNFENSGGMDGVVIKPDGTPWSVDYGTGVQLAHMCPGWTEWHNIMKNVVREMESTLPISGVYFDQIAAITPPLCTNTEHNHLPGGGSYWSDLYNEMINTIKDGRPKESFYFTECNSEAFVGSFDGVLTWEWNVDGLVPAYPMVYAGYVQMVGRNTDVSANDSFFRYHFAQAVMFGQQPGWFHANMNGTPARVQFMKQCVAVRMENLDVFNNGHLLRPPVIESEINKIKTDKGTYDSVITQAWQTDDGSKTVVFVANITSKKTTVTLKVHPEEYGVSCEETIEVTIPGQSIQAIVLDGKQIDES